MLWPLFILLYLSCHLSAPTLPKTALSLRPAPHSWLMNALLALRPCKAFGRSTSGIHARPLSKVSFCCWALLSQLLRDCYTTLCLALTLTIPANNCTQINRYTTKRLSFKKRATGTFFEDEKAIIYKFRETFYLAKSFPDPSKNRFILRNFAFCGKRFKAPP